MQGDKDAERGEDLVLRDHIAKQALDQFKPGLKHRESSVDRWNRNEDMYQNKVGPALEGRFNVPLPIMSGFVDTLHAKIDDKPALEFSLQGKADFKRAKKVTATHRIDSSSARANWAKKDRISKKMAIPTGIGGFKIFAENDPKYKHFLEAIDPYDWVADPIGGSDVELHRFGFQDNIFKSEFQIRGVKHYNQDQVEQLVSSNGDAEFKRNELSLRGKLNRFSAIGMDIDHGGLKDFAGDNLFRLTEGFTDYKGERWYVLMDMETGIWLRVEKLRDVFDSKGRGNKDEKTMLPWVFWHTHPDPFNFYSKAPADDIYPIASAMRTIFNQGLYNISKRNAGQRAYDPDIFTNPAQLEFRPDGLVAAYASQQGKNIGQGVYEFQTPDNTPITINLMNYLDNFLGQKTGITASAQGATDKDAKVGVYYGDLQQVADRLGLYNKEYSDAWECLGYRYIRDLWENFSEGVMIEWLGEDGIQIDELMKEDIDPSLVAIVKGGNAEIAANELQKRQKRDTIAQIQGNPLEASLLNPRWTIENKMRFGGFDEEEIREATDQLNFGSREELSDASQAIQDILQGKDVEVNFGATTAYMQKIVNFATKNRSHLEPKQVNDLMQHALLHKDLALENLERLALLQRINPQVPQGASPTAPVVPANTAVPNTPEGTFQRSGETSEALTP